MSTDSDSWRSKEVYECGVCGTQTNEWYMGGYPGRGPRIRCEAGIYSEHAEIEKTQTESTSLGKKIDTYSTELAHDHITESTRAKAKELLARLQTEQELLQAKIARLRELFATKAMHNVQEVTGNVTPIVRWFGTKIVPEKKRSLAEELSQTSLK